MLSSGEVILELRNVHSGYGRMEILKGVSLKVMAGEIVTLIGANGAGKTTILNTICGLIKVNKGAIHLFGEDLSNVPTAERVRRGLAQAPEGRKLFTEMTVLENLEIGAYLRHDKRGIAKDLEYVFELFPILKDRRKQLAGCLSGGEQQMCAIGRALMTRPSILLLDEPSLGLAPLLVKQIFDIIKQLNDKGATILLVEQNARMALKCASRGYVLETGSILLSDAAETLLEDEKVKQAYLGE